jgi:hypothetical protein
MPSLSSRRHPLTLRLDRRCGAILALMLYAREGSGQWRGLAPADQLEGVMRRIKKQGG